MNINVNTSLENLFKIATDAVNEINSEGQFIVKDLFRGFEWNRISKGNRTKLGGMFFNYSKNEGSGVIRGIGKTPQNQQKYEKL